MFQYLDSVRGVDKALALMNDDHIHISVEETTKFHAQLSQPFGTFDNCSAQITIP